jgi:hypothetical protein
MQRAGGFEPMSLNSTHSGNAKPMRKRKNLGRVLVAVNRQSCLIEENGAQENNSDG